MQWQESGPSSLGSAHGVQLIPQVIESPPIRQLGPLSKPHRNLSGLNRCFSRQECRLSLTRDQGDQSRSFKDNLSPRQSLLRSPHGRLGSNYCKIGPRGGHSNWKCSLFPGSLPRRPAWVPRDSTKSETRATPSLSMPNTQFLPPCRSGSLRHAITTLAQIAADRTVLPGLNLRLALPQGPRRPAGHLARPGARAGNPQAPGRSAGPGENERT